MRVIGGEARGRPLRAPVPPGVRPTSDRVREAIFDVLASLDAVAGASVLDAFAGSGALGIEALSRGAASVTFVDESPAAVAAVRANLAELGWARRPGVRVVRGEAFGYLEGLGEPFDLALVDPPYRFDRWPALLERLPARVAVLESSVPVEPAGGFDVYRMYRHGGTLVTVVRSSGQPGGRATSAPGSGEEAST